MRNVGSGGFNANAIDNALRMFEREMKQAIIPFVEKNYRVDTVPKKRAMAGLSLGGLHTLYTGINNTDMFSYLGVFSSGWIQPLQSSMANAQYEFMKKNTEKINHNLKAFWIAMGGKEDIAYNNCQLMLEKLNELKIAHTYSEYPGGHTWPVWRNNLYNFAGLLFKDQ